MAKTKDHPAEDTPRRPGTEDGSLLADMGTADDAALDEHQAAINSAVDRVVDGEDVRTVLEALLYGFPAQDRDVVIARFRCRIEELNQEYARRRAEEERLRAKGILRDGVLFNLASAVLLMSTGTYESIVGLFGQKPDLATQVANAGRDLLIHGSKPDMKMVQRLQEIYARAIQEQREREVREREAGSEAEPTG